MQNDTVSRKQPIHKDLHDTVMEMLNAIRKGCDSRSGNVSDDFEMAALEAIDPIAQAAMQVEAGDHRSAAAVLADVEGKVKAITPHLTPEERPIFEKLPAVVTSIQRQLLKLAA